MTKADMIPKFLVLVLIIVGVGKERVGALPVVDPPWQPNILPAAGWERMVAGMLASPTTKILVFVGDCVDKCGCRGCFGCFGCYQTGALTSMEERD